MTKLKQAALTIFLVSGVMVASFSAGAAQMSGTEIVEQCNYKYPGNDQRSRLSILLKDKNGSEKKKVFLRLWKNYHGSEGIVDKMMLFTEFPPDAKGAAFMRWAFDPETGKNADQWIYLPVLRKIRRVSIRDQGDSFMGSDLTYSDISLRKLDQDEHRFLGVERRDGKEFYIIESVPKEKKPLYSKRISWFSKGSDWEGCVKSRIDYYDLKGDLLKEQYIKWQTVDNAWVWKTVYVKSKQTGHSSRFLVDNVEIDVGLKDSVFSDRVLRRGYKAK